MAYREIYKVTSEYIGPDVRVYNDYDPSYIEVKVYYKDSPVVPEDISLSQCVIPDLYVAQEGQNDYYLTWTSPQGKSYKLTYIVNGIGIDHLWARYDDHIMKGREYALKDVHITLVYKDNYVEEIPFWQCTFNPDRVIHHPYDNEYTVKYRDKGGNVWEAVYNVFGVAVKKVEVEYKGPDILLLDSFDTSDVHAFVYYTDESMVGTPRSRLQFSDEIILHTGDNNKTVMYTDICGDTWAIGFIVPGIRRPIKLEAEYTGITKIIDDEVPDHEIEVKISYLTDNYEVEVETIPYGEWYWVSLNVVNVDNKGHMVVGWQHDYIYKTVTLNASCDVPYIELDKSWLLAWYEGPPIEIGNTFNKDHVVIYLCPPVGDRIRLHYYTKGIIMEISAVEKVGDNWYEVTFVRNNIKLTARYSVPGVIYKIYPDPDFRVWFVHKDSLPGIPREIDLTEEFREYFTFHGVFVISWEQFLRRVYDFVHKDGTPYLGMFGIIAPKNTGLFNKYASWWHVYCFNDHTLKAEIYKLYDTPIREENENGSKQESESST